MAKRLKLAEEEEAAAALLAGPTHIVDLPSDIMIHGLAPYLDVRGRVRFLCGTSKRLRAEYGYPHIIGSDAAPVWIRAAITTDYRVRMHVSLIGFLRSRTQPGNPMRCALDLMHSLAPATLPFLKIRDYYHTNDYIPQYTRIVLVRSEWIQPLTRMPEHVELLFAEAKELVITRGLEQALAAPVAPISLMTRVLAKIQSVLIEGFSPAFKLTGESFPSVLSALNAQATVSIANLESCLLTRFNVSHERIQSVKNFTIRVGLYFDLYANPLLRYGPDFVIPRLASVMEHTVQIMKKSRAIDIRADEPRMHAIQDHLLHLFALETDRPRHIRVSIRIDAAPRGYIPRSNTVASVCTHVTLTVHHSTNDPAYLDAAVAALRQLEHFTAIQSLTLEFYAPPRTPAIRIAVPGIGEINLHQWTNGIRGSIAWPAAAPPDRAVLRRLAREIYYLLLLSAPPLPSPTKRYHFDAPLAPSDSTEEEEEDDDPAATAAATALAVFPEE